ncbi:replication-associated recombination protein A [Leucobacter sp. UT-8R-CII-1-4]|uniref:replication-associated recombination protein A n=1 Tax=Leucobacter sp. UT-8R-CII-1-4 TaxID=3040075 RepID=UPI0024A9B222|nr:replication-associated recombination protein A [Leucobacter sp. UT-8R-CII-1-4]MDI6024187.1 replication-associated recombination protein A [Leucobacter sp. UT-8R-CII-1-4]
MTAPLAVRMRPRTLDEVVGQQHLLRSGSPLRVLAEAGDGSTGAVSLILWGPPGTGKTTLAQAIASSSGRRFVELSAVTAGIKDVRTVMERALNDRDLYGVATVLFLDEIHRFTKAQQDALLPGVENGWVTLVAATTENPSFSVISPLLSRSLLLTLQPLEDADLALLLRRAVADPRGLAGTVELSEEALAALVQLASGDARRALTGLEAAAASALASAASPVNEAAVFEAEDRLTGEAEELLAGEADFGSDDEAEDVDDDGCDDADENGDDSAGEQQSKADSDAEGELAAGIGVETQREGDPAPAAQATLPVITAEIVSASIDRALLRYDRNGDEHYDVISAFIKSIRGSDPDAAIHYLARMIEAGEDPRFIARRLMVHAAEDIGMADPQALQIAVAAAEATQMIGLPEARLPLAEATIYLATAPKSNAVISAIDTAIADVRAGKFGRVPPPLRDAHYPGAKRLGHGKGYKYPHSDPLGVVRQQHLPDELVNRVYYQPSDHGNERAISERLEKIRRITRG